MRQLRFTAACGLSLLLTGCAALSSSDMAGTYQDNNPLGMSSLILRPDGTFSQTLITKSRKKHTVTGKWSFDASKDHIQFDTLLSLKDSNPPGHPSLSRTGGSYAVEKGTPDGPPQIVLVPGKSLTFDKVQQIK